jgi:transposase, IS6 family
VIFLETFHSPEEIDAMSYRDVEELLAERGIEVDHVTVYRWVQRFTPLCVDAARPLRMRRGPVVRR